MAATKTMDCMSYELTGSKTSSKGNSKRVAIKCAEELNTSRLLWIVVMRHKVGLLMVGNCILVLNTVFPPWFDMVKSLVR